MHSVRIYGKNRKYPFKGRSYWTDIESWKRSRLSATGIAPRTINVTTATQEWSRNLSPILLGPVQTYREGRRNLSAISVELAWQYSKVYSHEKIDGKQIPLDFQREGGQPNAKWFAWRDAAWSNPKFHWEHTHFEPNKRHIRRAFPKGSTVAGWYWNGKMLDCVTARREIYATLYCRHVRQSPAYRQLLDLQSGGDVVIYDMDGYDYTELAMSPEDTIHDISHSWGHGMLLTFLLNGIDPTQLGRSHPHKLSPLQSTLLSHSLSSNPMNALQNRRKEIQSELAEIDKLDALTGKIEKLVKAAGFTNFDAFLQKVGQPQATGTPLPAIADKGVSAFRKVASPKKGKKGKRPRITDAQLAQMKELRDAGMSHAKIGKKLGISPMSVFNWSKLNFKRK